MNPKMVVDTAQNYVYYKYGLRTPFVILHIYLFVYFIIMTTLISYV